MTLYELARKSLEENDLNAIDKFLKVNVNKPFTVRSKYKKMMKNFTEACNIQISNKQVCHGLNLLDGQVWGYMITVADDKTKGMGATALNFINRDTGVVEEIAKVWSQDIELAKSCLEDVNWFKVFKDGIGWGYKACFSKAIEAFGEHNLYYEYHTPEFQWIIKAVFELGKYIECNFDSPEKSSIKFPFVEDENC